MVDGDRRYMNDEVMKELKFNLFSMNKPLIVILKMKKKQNRKEIRT